MKRNMKRVGWAGASAAVALVATGLLAPATAFAGNNDSVAPTSGAAFDATAKELLNTDQVKVVGTDGEGNVVIFTSAGEDQLSGKAEAFADGKSNVVVKKLDSDPSTLATTDVVGGAGYAAPFPGNTGQAGLCSVGYSGFSPSGKPAVITAGHCTKDGLLTDTFLTLPSGDAAAGGSQPAATAPLGTFGFSQFGGPGNTAGAKDQTSVDIAVIDVKNNDLSLKPAITDWTTASSEDLSKSTIPVRSVGKAQIGPFSKSGRTTGYTQGDIQIVNGWISVEGREVYGFGGPINLDHGDSGGAMFQGNTAVGVTSAEFTYQGVKWGWGADLEAGLAQTNGYSVAIQVDAPVLTSPENGGNVGIGGTISGTAQANTTLTVTPKSGDARTIEVGGDGQWSFPAPDKLGTFEFSLKSNSGFSTSPSVDESVNVLPQAPVITSPADGSQIVSSLTAVSGTGLAGATVTLSGDVTGTATVGTDGNWSVAASLKEGAYKVTAVQKRDGIASATSTSSFTVIPTAPTIDGITDGASYSDSAIPTKFSGAGQTGADLAVTLNGAQVGAVKVANGAWSVALKDALAPGDYTVVATQTVNGQSNSTTVAFSVAAAPSPSPSTPAPGPAGNKTLPQTGANDPAPLAMGAAALLLAGLGAVGYRRLRRVNR